MHISKYCIGTLSGTRLRLPQIGKLFSEDKKKGEQPLPTQYWSGKDSEGTFQSAWLSTPRYHTLNDSYAKVVSFQPSGGWAF